MNNSSVFKTREDIDRAEYERLRVMLGGEQTAETFLHHSRLVMQFLTNEPNPAYGDALVTQALSRGHLVVLALLDEPATYGSLMTKRVATSALRVQSHWQGIMNHNASHTE